MKVYLGKPRYHWISPYTIIDHIFFWKPWSSAFKDRWDESITEYPNWVEPLSDFLTPVSKGIQWVLDKIHPQMEYIKIDYWDVWSMDYTLSPIILPMLKKLKEVKHGSGFIDDADVPWELRSYSIPKTWEDWETDPLIHERYEWLLDELIWTFEQLASEDKGENKFHDHSKVDPNEKDIMKQVQQMELDIEGLKAHQARVQNGLCLFGKYFQTLWD